MQSTRANARSSGCGVINNDFSHTSITTTAATPNASFSDGGGSGVPGNGNGVTGNKVTVFPSRPPAHVEQQKRQRLQRQKEIHTFYQRYVFFPKLLTNYLLHSVEISKNFLSHIFYVGSISGILEAQNLPF